MRRRRAANGAVRSAPDRGKAAQGSIRWISTFHVPDVRRPKMVRLPVLAMVTSICQGNCAIPVRRDIAMTGEVSLRRGNASISAALKEKLFGGAQRRVFHHRSDPRVRTKKTAGYPG